MFVRDLRSNTTTLTSAAVPKAAVAASRRSRWSARRARAGRLSRAAVGRRAKSAAVSIFDNAFHLGQDGRRCACGPAAS